MRNARINDLNDAIDALAAQSTTTSPIVIVDQNAGFSAANDTYDGIHPNATGEEKLAKKWFSALQLFFLKGSPGIDAEHHLTMSYTRVKDAPELIYAVEVTADPGLWSSGPAVTDELSVIDNQNGTERVLTRDRESSDSQPRRFIRLRLHYGP